MSFNIKTAIALTVRKYIAPTVVVLLVLAGGMVYVWSEYKDLRIVQDNLIKERKSLSDEIVASEKNRADAAIALISQKVELEKREFILSQLESQNQEKLTELKKHAIEYKKAFEDLQLAQSSVGEKQRQQLVEDKLQNLMSQFSELGVDLNSTIRCTDADGIKRYNVARAKYSEIYTLAEANRLVNKFNSFFMQNREVISSSCRY